MKIKKYFYIIILRLPQKQQSIEEQPSVEDLLQMHHIPNSQLQSLYSLHKA